MATDFQASNKLLVTCDGQVFADPDDTFAPLPSPGIETRTALLEWAQHEHDLELGRWRDSKEPDLVVYPLDTNAVTVFDEITESEYLMRLNEIRLEQGDPINDAVRRYLAAQPRPAWHDAKPGQLWIVSSPTFNAARGVGVLVEDFVQEGLVFLSGNETMESITSTEIVAAERIWSPDGDTIAAAQS